MFSSPATTTTQLTSEELRALRAKYNALDNHRTAMFVLTQKDRPIPSLQDMKNDLDKDELSSLKERIATLKSDHRSNLERLYIAHAEDYLDDQKLKRESRDESLRLQTDSFNRLSEWAERRDIFSSQDYYYKRKLSDDITKECFRYAKALHLLEQQKRELERLEEEERRRRDAAFPLSLEEFNSKPRDIQLRIASFLNADSVTKERMMSRFGWAWRQTDPLSREFHSNAEFKSEILRLLEMLDSRDPRKKPFL